MTTDPQPTEAEERLATLFIDRSDGDFAELAGMFARHAQQAREEGRQEERERIARMVDKRRDDRFAEHGTTESDTNASYYSGRAGETYESLDEEDEAIAAAIRNLSKKDQSDG